MRKKPTMWARVRVRNRLTVYSILDVLLFAYGFRFNSTIALFTAIAIAGYIAYLLIQLRKKYGS